MRKRTTAALLAFFLGIIGIHRFYLGQVGLGLLYLLFCWVFFIPALIGIIDMIVFLSMDDKKFNEKYNAAITVQSDNSYSAADEIKKLYEMKEKGIITQDEYELKKKLLL